MKIYKYNFFTYISKLFDRSSAVFPSRVSFLVCTLLAAAGISIGIIENSLAVTTNGFIAGTEILSSLLFLSAIKQSIRAPDYSFNYGYGKYESMAMLAGALLLSVILVFTIIEAIKDFGIPSPVKNHYVLLIYSFTTFFIIRRMASYLKNSSEKFHLPLLAYDADNWNLDSFIESGVLLNLICGTVLSLMKLDNIGKIIDSSSAILLLLYSLKTQLKHGKSALNQLLDRTLPENIQFDIISAVAENINKMCEFKTVYTRQSGKDIFIEIDVVMPWDYTLEEAYELEKDMKSALIAKYPTALPRLYVTPCLRDCIHQGKSYCPIKLAKAKLSEQNNPDKTNENEII